MSPLIILRDGQTPALFSLCTAGVEALALVERMKWDDIEQSWPDLRWRARRHWYWLTEEDVCQITGNREQLIDRVQRRYRFPREQAEKEVDAWASLIQTEPPV